MTLTGFLNRDDVMTRLREKVSQLGSQKAVAEKIGISQQWLSDILRGHREPTGHVLNYLGLDSMRVYLERKKSA